VSASRGSCASGQVVVAKQLCLIRALDALIKCEKAGLGHERGAGRPQQTREVAQFHRRRLGKLKTSTTISPRPLC
jgi:hypothetical protein